MIKSLIEYVLNFYIKFTHYIDEPLLKIRIPRTNHINGTEAKINHGILDVTGNEICSHIQSR